MSKFDHKEWDRHLKDTESLEELTMSELKQHLRYFKGVRECLEVVTDQRSNGKKDTCEERIELLRKEIQHRRSRKPSWVAILSLIVATASLCLGIHNCARSTRSEQPTPAATPQQSPSGTPSQ
jgi:hypothetical protein